MVNIFSSKRTCNFELLRIIGMLAIISHHLAYHGLYTPLSKEYFFNTTLIQALNFGGKFGVIIFILLSGYFLINQGFKLNKFLRLLTQYLFYSIVILLIASYFHLIKLNYKLIITAIFPLTGFSWFADAYILLYIFHPFLNKFIKSLKERELELFLALGAIIWFLIPTIANIFKIYLNMNFSNAVLFSYFYCFGAYIKLFDKELKSAGKIAAISYLFYLALSVVLFHFDTNMPYLNHNAFFLGLHNSLFIFTTSVSTFLYFKELQLKPNFFIYSLSSTVFGIYLIHDNDLIRHYLWHNLATVNKYYGQPYFILYAFTVILVIFFSCSFIEFLRLNYLDKPMFKKLEPKIQHLEECINL